MAERLELIKTVDKIHPERNQLSLFNSIADGAWEETVTCENGNRPQDWTFVSSGYTITYDEATAE